MIQTKEPNKNLPSEAYSNSWRINLFSSYSLISAKYVPRRIKLVNTKILGCLNFIMILNVACQIPIVGI